MLNATLRCNSMTLEPNFESMSFNPFSNNNNFSDSNQDPDVNFFLGNIPSLNTEYFLPSNVKIGFSKFESPDKFLVLHLNIRSLTKNFEDFKELYKTLNLKFSVVCFSVTWADDNKLEDYSSIQLPGYNVLHQIRKNRRYGGINIFVYKSLSFKRRQDLGINSEAVKSLGIEILNKKCKNIIHNRIYRPQNGDIETCEIYFKNLFAGDFNLNVLDFENFTYLMFRYGMIPTINKPMQITTNTVTPIDYIIPNVIIDTDFKAKILKSCILDHFAIMLAFPIGEKKMCKKSKQHIYKRIFHETSTESFRLLQLR